MVPGDVLFMHRRCMHASLSNHSDNVHWSFDIRYNPTGQSTGRESLPSFIARSRENPASELRDPNTWYQMWVEVRDRMLKNDFEAITPRWDGSDEICA